LDIKDSPRTVADAVDYLLASLTDTEKETLKGIPEHDLNSECHFGLAMWVRNHFDLHSKSNQPLLEDCARVEGSYFMTDDGKEVFMTHPDDASAVIVKEAWKRLRSYEP
jgi:hypothetical protein